MIHRPVQAAREELARINAAIEAAKAEDGPDYIFMEKFRALSEEKMRLFDTCEWEDV